MNPEIENFFKAVEQRLPQDELLQAKDLVKAGIAKSSSTLATWRKHQYGPSYLTITPGTIRYVKSAVMDWLRRTHQPMLPFMYPAQKPTAGVSA